MSRALTRSQRPSAEGLPKDVAQLFRTHRFEGVIDGSKPSRQCAGVGSGIDGCTDVCRLWRSVPCLLQQIQPEATRGSPIHHDGGVRHLLEYLSRSSSSIVHEWSQGGGETAELTHPWR